MAAVIRLLWDICFLRAGPQDLPASYSFMGLAVAGYGAMAVLVAHISLPTHFTATLAAAVDTALLVVMSRVVLWARMLGNRWMQTLTALAGTGCIFELVLWPIDLWQAQQGTVDPVFGLPLVLVLSILVWNVAVTGHILRNALSTSMFNGTLLAVVYTYVTISIFRTLFLAHQTV